VCSESYHYKQQVASDCIRSLDPPEIVETLETAANRWKMSWFRRQAGSNPVLEDRFREAARVGNLEEVTKCLRQNVNVNASKNAGWTALHSSSYSGHLEVVQCLVQDGKADVEVKSKYEETALHCACQNGHLAVVQYLVRDGKADVEAKRIGGWTALHCASLSGHLEMVQYLVRDGKANVEAETNGGCTALHWASQNGHLDVVQYLVREGKANVEAETNGGWTALHYACRNGHLAVVQYLVQDGKANVEAKVNDGCTALHVACLNGHLAVVQYLVQDGNVNFYAVTNEDKSALDLALEKGKYNVVEFLFDYFKDRPISIPTSSPTADSLFESMISQGVAGTNIGDNNEEDNEKEIIDSRNELQRVLSDPMAEPACWNVKYLEECTDNFTSKVLGEGAFGKVYFGCDKVLGFPFAVKRVPLTVPDPDILNTIVDSFRREVLVCCLYQYVVPINVQQLFIICFCSL
jgi:ankyrin repeat protein